MGMKEFGEIVAFDFSNINLELPGNDNYYCHCNSGDCDSCDYSCNCDAGCNIN
jgi:hypothetical protein